MAKVKGPTLFECVACAHQTATVVRPQLCQNCGRGETYSIIDVFGGKSSAIRATDIVSEEPPRYQSGDSELDSLLLGGFVRPSTLTAFGRGGTGKSRSCLRWACHLGETLLVSLEMPSKLAVYSAQQARADLSKLSVTESEDDWHSQAIELKASVVVLDSFHYSQKQRVVKGGKVPVICAELAAWAKAEQGIAFLICHSNKKNEVSGTTAAEHWPDYLFQFQKHGDSEAKITIPKSRYSPTGACIVTI